MSTSELVRKLCEEHNVTLAELARRTGQSRQNLYNKLRRDSISVDIHVEKESDRKILDWDRTYFLTKYYCIS